MPKDYVHRSSKKRLKAAGSRIKAKRRKSLGPFFVRLFVIIIIICLLIFAGIKLVNHKQDIFKHFSLKSLKTALRHHKVETPKPVVKPIEEEQPAENKVKFEFFRMLPRMSVEVYNESEDSNVTVSQPVSKHLLYVLQLASVKNSEDANNFKKRLNELGYKPKIIQVNRGDVTWHRVQLGPYVSVDAAEKASNNLLSQGINSILLKMTENPPVRPTNQ